MTKSLCAKCSGQRAEDKWLPMSINNYREIILARYSGEEYTENHELYPVFSNIAYNLQYLEYLNKCFEELYLTSVLRAQNTKMFTLTVSQIIECLLYNKLTDLGVAKNDIWDFGNNLRMSEKKNAFALGQQFYKTELKWLKDLRNRIHIQSPSDIKEADYAVFESLEVLNRSKKVLFTFLQKSLSLPTDKMEKLFYFLLPTKEFIHSKE